jgi:superfamily II DNA or RNA helicase
LWHDERDWLVSEFYDSKKFEGMKDGTCLETSEGVQLRYPYQPYKCQVDYMKSVIKSISTHNYAALESPTGTGKTLCLLTAALGWLHHYYQGQKD